MENNLIPIDMCKKLIIRIWIVKLIVLLSVLALICFFVFIFSRWFYCIIDKTFIGIVCVLSFAAWGWMLMLKEKFSCGFLESVMSKMALFNNWVCDKKFEDKSWHFMDNVERYQLLYGCCNYLKAQFILCGKSCNRDFSFYLLKPYRSKDSDEYILIKTNSIPNFNNIILISPEIDEEDAEHGLKEVKIDTQNFFSVYAKDPQNAAEVLSQDFINALIERNKTTDEIFTILITPKGILLATELNPKASIFFSSPKKYLYSFWNFVENFIKLLDLINLLEKK